MFSLSSPLARKNIDVRFTHSLLNQRTSHVCVQQGVTTAVINVLCSPTRGSQRCGPATTGACGALPANYAVSWVAGDNLGIGNRFQVELISYRASSWAFRCLRDFPDGWGFSVRVGFATEQCERQQTERWVRTGAVHFHPCFLGPFSIQRQQANHFNSFCPTGESCTTVI